MDRRPLLNRASILEHPLDWRLMGLERGIASGVRPEIPANFLRAYRDDVAILRVDGSGANRCLGGRRERSVAKGDPSDGGGGGGSWLLLPEPLVPERLRLLGSNNASRPAG